MRNLDGRRFIGHGGGMVGYLAGLQADTDANLGAIVLQNGMGAHPMTLARTVIRIADGEPAKSAGTARLLRWTNLRAFTRLTSPAASRSS